MPTLDFKGKQHIYSHHLTVPYRPLKPDEGRSCDPSDTDDNLIIHGDNLHALKALLPCYANRIKCIYIDPPYNTGSQAWVYNDNVNSPLMQEWLKQNSPIDSEDLERHDKWMCMMWPRLHLLRELLADDGVIFVSIDDHEQWRLLGLMEEIFGERNFIATLTFIQNLGAYPGKWLSHVTEYVHIFAKDVEQVNFAPIPTDEDPSSDWDQDEIGYYREGSELLKRGEGGKRDDRPNMYFPLFIDTNRSVSLTRHSPNDIELLPLHSDGTEGRWMWSRERFANNITEIIVKSRSNGSFSLVTKMRPNIGDTLAKKPRSLWYKPEYSTPSGTNTLKTIFNGQRVFDFAKAVPFVSDLLRFANVGPNAIVLDSFAGSGTTAHAVLALNKEDGGNRKFILIECEEYANTITTERVRRVINGVLNASDASLREGLGGSFTYSTLDEPIDTEGLLTGDTLPAYETLAGYITYVATGSSLKDIVCRADYFFGETDTLLFYLIYEPSLKFLESNQSALDGKRATQIARRCKSTGKQAYVYAAQKFMGQKELTDMGITFCQLPYNLYRITEA